MRKAAETAILLATLFVAAAGVRAQSPANDEKARDGKAYGSVSGAVTINGKPARGIKVVAIRVSPLAIDFTDEAGRYDLKALPAGLCRVTVDAAGFTMRGEGDDWSSSGKSVEVGSGEMIEGIDFDLIPGGVITGRVTEADGRPIIGEFVVVIPFEEGKNPDYYTPAHTNSDRRLDATTDDRGIYRAYGLPPGRYLVRIGDPGRGRVRPLYGRLPFPMTYYADAKDNARPGVVELAQGGEVIDIDIKIVRPPLDRSKTYTVIGRIIDAETGSGLGNVRYSCKRVPSGREPEGRDYQSVSEYGGTNPKGEFRLAELPAGTYKIKVRANAQSPWYSNEETFEVSHADVEGLEVKVYRAGSISGVVVLEGAHDPAIAARLSQLSIGDGFSSYTGGQVNGDGTFQLNGLNPGSHGLSITADGIKAGFELIRIEQDGVEKKLRLIVVGPGEQVAGVRVVVSYNKGVIRGQIKIEGGTLPKGADLIVSATPTNRPKRDRSLLGRLDHFLDRWRHGTIDARGQFVIERLPPGEYEVNLDAYLASKGAGDDEEDSDDNGLNMTVTKVVTVTEQGAAVVSLVLDLSNKPEVKRR